MDENKLKLFDPTPNKKYVSWLKSIQKQGVEIKDGDMYEYINILLQFDKVKHKIEDISQRNIFNYKSIAEVNNAIEHLSNYKSRKDIKNDIDLFYEDNDWLVIIPKTKEAAIQYGKNTKWCTASKYDESNMFDYYNNIGDIYIIIHKLSNTKFQSHFASNSIANDKDEMNQGKYLWSLFNNNIKNHFAKNNLDIYFIYNKIFQYPNNLTCVEISNHKYNILNQNKEFILPNHVENISIHEYYINEYIDNCNNTISNDDIIVKIRTKGLYTFANLNGKYITPNNYFRQVDNFFMDYGIVYIDNKPKYIDKNGNFIRPINHDKIYQIKRAEYKINNVYYDKITFIDKYNPELLDQVNMNNNNNNEFLITYDYVSTYHDNLINICNSNDINHYSFQNNFINIGINQDYITLSYINTEKIQKCISIYSFSNWNNPIHAKEINLQEYLKTLKPNDIINKIKNVNNNAKFTNPLGGNSRYYNEIIFHDNTKNILLDNGTLLLNKNYQDIFFANQFIYLKQNNKWFIADKDANIINKSPIDEIISVFSNDDNPMSIIRINNTHYVIDKNCNTLTHFNI